MFDFVEALFRQCVCWSLNLSSVIASEFQTYEVETVKDTFCIVDVTETGYRVSDLKKQNPAVDLFPIVTNPVLND